LQSMSGQSPPESFAWQPLTPGGVAALARAPVRRLLFVQFVFALMAAASMIWFLRTAWFPTVSAAIGQLPVRGEIHRGKLTCPINEPTVLADGHFLAVSVDLKHQGKVRSPAHVQVEFGGDAVYFFSLFGYQPVYYPPDQIIAFNRTELEPKWGAWQPPILWITFTVIIAGLMASWAALATLYFFPVWLVGFFFSRALDLRASWKLAGAALMPGALLLVIAILLYGLGVVDLVQLFAAFAAHLLIGWIYAGGSPLFASKLEINSEEGNPFAGKNNDEL
jgi:hypothetical protein